VRRRWLGDAAYGDLVALCQFLPGPASSQVGIAIGLTRAGLPGALAAWLGFTLPSAVAMILFAYFIDAFVGEGGAPWLQGLKVAAAAVVANAVWGMARSLSADRERATLTVVPAVIVLFWPTALGQIGAILLGAVVGVAFLGGAITRDEGHLAVPIGRRSSSGSCSRPSTIRCGPAASGRPPISPWPPRPCCCWPSGSCRPGWW
jgi:chromate transporter